MNDIITDREDLFWAKMAGRDVDISTMTPPVAASVRETLMLEVANRIARGGSGGGGDDNFIVPLAIDGDDLKFDGVSPEDVLQAYKSDKLVVAKINTDTVEGEEGQITGFLCAAVKKPPESDQMLTATLYLFYFQFIDVGTGMPGSLLIFYANDTFWGSDTTYSAFVPLPGEEDEGKVLLVEGREYRLGDLNTVIPLHGTARLSNGDLYLDLTEDGEQILSALNTGKPIILIIDASQAVGFDSTISAFCTASGEVSNKTQLNFSAITDEGNIKCDVVGVKITIDEEDDYATTADIYTRRYTRLPDFDAGQAGYILKINAGGDDIEWVSPT